LCRLSVTDKSLQRITEMVAGFLAASERAAAELEKQGQLE
jgi:hypothetical protein